MGIVEKEGGLPVFDTDILNNFLCHLLKLLPGFWVKSVNVATWLLGKIDARYHLAPG